MPKFNGFDVSVVSHGNILHEIEFAEDDINSTVTTLIESEPRKRWEVHWGALDHAVARDIVIEVNYNGLVAARQIFPEEYAPCGIIRDLSLERDKCPPVNVWEKSSFIFSPNDSKDTIEVKLFWVQWCGQASTDDDSDYNAGERSQKRKGRRNSNQMTSLFKYINGWKVQYDNNEPFALFRFHCQNRGITGRSKPKGTYALQELEANSRKKQNAREPSHASTETSPVEFPFGKTQVVVKPPLAILESKKNLYIAGVNARKKEAEEKELELETIRRNIAIQEEAVRHIEKEISIQQELQQMEDEIQGVEETLKKLKRGLLQKQRELNLFKMSTPRKRPPPDSLNGSPSKKPRNNGDTSEGSEGNVSVF